MRLTQQESLVVTPAFEGKHQVSECRFEGNPAVISLFVLQELAAKFRLCQKKKEEVYQAVLWSVMFRKSI